MLYLSILNITLSIAVTILLVFCLFLIWRCKKLLRQYCFLVSVLICELIYSCYHLVLEIGQLKNSIALGVLISSNGMSVINVPYCGCLILLTLERFLEVYLHINYYSSFFYRNRLRLCIALWILALIIMIITSVLFLTTDNLLKLLTNLYTIDLYFLLVVHAAILISFVTVYAYLYRLFRTNRAANVIKRSKIFAPFFIVLTFLCFLTIPLIVSMLILPEEDHTWAFVINRLNSLSDGFFYVLLIPNIRKRLLKFRTGREYQCRKHENRNLSLSTTVESQDKKETAIEAKAKLSVSGQSIGASTQC